MGTKKKASTQPKEEEQLLSNLEGNPTKPEESQRGEDSTRGGTNNSQEGAENGGSTNSEDCINKANSKSDTSKIKKEEILQRGKGQRKKQGTKTKKETLTSALTKYPGGKDEALSIFREQVSKLGYNGIEKQMIPIVEEYGTTKDKVALILNAHFEMDKESKRPLLSRKRAEEIKAGVREEGRKEMVEFMNALSLYDALNYIVPYFYRLKFCFLSMAYQCTIYFQTYEWLGKAEELFNSFAPLVDPSKREKFAKLAESYNSYLQTYKRFGELEEKSGSGWVDEQKEDCFRYAEFLTTNRSRTRLSELKGCIEAIEEWAKVNGAEMFLSMALRDQIEIMKTQTIEELQSKYFSTHLKEIEAEGKTPTDADRRMALFPDYNEVERNEVVYNNIYTKLDDSKKVYK